MKFSGLVVLAASAAASPLRFRSASGKRDDISVTATDIQSMYLYSQYAGAAYCNSDVAVGSTIACAGSVCPNAEADAAKIVATLSTDSLLSELTDMQGFVATDDVANVLVVSLRGTISIENWMTNIDFIFEDCSDHLTAGLADSIGSGCQMHDGFGAAWDSLRTTTLDAVNTYKGNRTVIVTGHSLGGAVATLAAAELRYAGIDCELYTYGSPRIGNEVLVEYLSSQAGAPSGVNNYRLTHLDDPVPKLPPRSFGYRHTSPEFWLNAGTTVTATNSVSYVPSDITICTGYATGDCNAGTLALLDVAAHQLYFTHMDGCQ